MKKFIVLSIVLGLTMPIGAAEIERQVTEKTTTYRGTVTELNPGSSTIMLRSESATAAMLKELLVWPGKGCPPLRHW